MSGLAGIAAVAASQAASATPSLTAPAPAGAFHQADVAAFHDTARTQLAFSEAIPASPISQIVPVQSEPTLGDRILDSLSRIGSSFGRLDALAPQGLAPDRAGSAISAQTLSDKNGVTTGMDTGGGISHPSAKHDVLAAHHAGTRSATDPESLLGRIQQQGEQLYNESISRQIALTNAEFETHVITVASQDMASTLKSLLSQGG